MPSELRWHPEALVDIRYTNQEILYVLRTDLSEDDAASLIDRMRTEQCPSLYHGGRKYTIVGAGDTMRLEIRSPGMVARLRSPVLPNYLDHNGRRENPTHGVCVVPVTPELRFRSQVVWGRMDNGRACWLSNQFHRGVLMLAPELLDAIALQASTGFACWWLPRAPGINADPIPHDYYASKQITRVIIAHPVRAKPDLMGDGTLWYKAFQELQPALRVNLMQPSPDRFPGLVMPAAAEIEADRGVRIVPADASRGDVTWLHALREGGRANVRQAIFAPLQISPQADVIVEPARDSRPEIMGGPIEWARRYLYDKFLQDGDSRWRLIRIMGGWWVMTSTGWESRTDEQMRHAAVAWMCTKSVRSDVHKEPEPLRPSEANIRQFMTGLSMETTSTSLQMPCWLHSTIEHRGDEAIPRWAQTADVLNQAKDPNVGRPDPDWLLSFENGILDMAALKAGRVEIRPLDPCYFGGPSIPYALDVEMLNRMLRLVPNAEYLSDEWVLAQEQIIEACKELAPVYVQSLLEQVGDHGPVHMADRMAVMRSLLGDLMSWIRVWEIVPLFIGKKRAGKDMTQYAIEAANGSASTLVINNFDELDDQYAFAPFVGRKIAKIPDGHFDYMTNRQASTKVKQLSGRGNVRVRDLYSPAIPNVKLSTRLAIFLNNMPIMKDASMALPTRFVVFPFTNSFADRTDDSRKDRVLLEGPGIGIMGLLGFYEAWSRRPRPGIHHPRIAEDLGIIERLIYSAAPLKEFATRCCDVDPGCGPVRLRDLYSAYRGAVAEAKIDVQGAIGYHRFCDEITHVCTLRPHGIVDGEREFTGIELNDAGLKLMAIGDDAMTKRRHQQPGSTPRQTSLGFGQTQRRDMAGGSTELADSSDIPF